MNALDDLKLRLKIDPGSYNAEWEIVSSVLEQYASESHDILRWLLAEHNGYVDTRSRAGEAYYQLDESDAWTILSQLNRSSDPDDRDTALAVASSIGGRRAANLVKHLLNDPYPYIQLEAAEFLAADFPNDVRICLQQLTKNNTQWIRDAANDLILQLAKS